MTSSVSVCEKIAWKNVDRLPKKLVRGYDGNPRREAVAEVFWNAVYEIVQRIIWPDLGDPDFPDEIQIGSQHVPIPFDEPSWDALLDELGLSPSGSADLNQLEQTLRKVLIRQFTVAADAPPAKVDLSAAPLSLRGLVVVLCFLAHLSRHKSPSSYRYELNSLTQFAGRELAWASLDLIDEGQLVREFFPRAGLAMDRTDNLWRVPYLACCRPLWKKISHHPPDRRELSTPEAVVTSQPSRDMPRDFLSGLMDEKPAEKATSDAEPLADNIRLELRRLRKENDCLRALREVELLESLLRPLLVVDEAPTEYDRVLRIAKLQEEVSSKVVDLLKSPTVDLFGDVGQRVSIQLPSMDYVLDESVPSKTTCDGQQYEIVRRGLRVLDRTMIPAVVVPVEPNRAGQGG